MSKKIHETMSLKVYDDTQNTVCVETVNGFFYVTFDPERKTTRISMYDHFSLTIEGGQKCLPNITVDSDEFPTTLKIVETESKWAKVSIKRKSGKHYD